jgi:hypothetical protein
MSPEEQKALESFVSAVRKRFGSALIDVAQIRTWPRKDDPPYHSVEIAIVLKTAPKALAPEESALADLVCDPLIETGLCIRFKIVTQSTWDKANVSDRRRAKSLLVAA